MQKLMSKSVMLKRLKEAEGYLNEMQWDKAHALFDAIRRQMQASLAQDDSEKKLLPSHRNKRIKAIQALNNKIAKIELKQKSAAAVISENEKETDDSAGDMDGLGVLLKDVGVHDEAIREFQRIAANNPELIGECHEHIAEALIAKGAIDEGIAAFRKAADMASSQEIRIEILEKIARTYEATERKQEAVNVYREIIFENPAAGRALQQIETLSSELKRSPLELSIVCRHPKKFFAASLVFALVFMVFNLFVKTVDNVDYFTIENHPDIIFYDQFKEVFGNDEFFVIAVESRDLFSKPGLEMLRDITEQLEGLEDAEDVLSLANVDDTIGGPDFFEVRPFLSEIPEDKEEFTALQRKAVQNRLYRKNLISVDGQTAAILVIPYDKSGDEDLRKRLIAQTKAILSPYEQQGVKFYLAGETITNLSLSQYLNEDMMVLIPATYLVVILTVWFFFRNVRIALLALANITLCVGATRGLMGLTGVTVNNVTTIVIPLVMAMALSDTVHIFSHMEVSVLKRFKDETRALSHVISKVGLPCFLTTFTTAIGFLSLSVSDIPPIREFAWIASAGMVFEFIFSFFFLPPLILFLNPWKLYQSYGTKSLLTRFLQKNFYFVSRYNRWIVGAGVLITVFALGASSQVRVETNLLGFFKKSSPVHTSLDFVESHLAGVSSIDISFKAQDIDAFKDPEYLQVIDQVQRFVAKLEGVDKTVSFVDFLKDMNQSFHNEDELFYTVPDSSELIAQYLLLYDSEDTEDYINSDYDHARLSVRISVHGTQQQQILIDRIQEMLDQIDPKGLEIRITGDAVELISVVDAIVQSQIYSLALATLVISVVMFLVFRSVGIAALSMLPNLFPILLNFGIMGALDIPLDTGTALIAAVALGIAVDDTIHFLTEYQRMRAQGIAAPKVLASVFEIKGRAIISSSLILCLGFGVNMLSRFVPVINFGLLCAIIMVTAVISDLVLLPAVILLKKKS